MGKGGVSRAQRGRSPQSRARASPIARDGPPKPATDRKPHASARSNRGRASLLSLSILAKPSLSLDRHYTHTPFPPPLIHFSAHQGSAMYEHGSETLVPGHGSQEVLHTAAASVVNKIYINSRRLQAPRALSATVGHPARAAPPGLTRHAALIRTQKNYRAG